MNQTLIQSLRTELRDKPPGDDPAFLRQVESIGLLWGLMQDSADQSLDNTQWILPTHVQYLHNHDDPEKLLISGMWLIEDLFYRAVGEDVSIPVISTQKWSLYFEALHDYKSRWTDRVPQTRWYGERIANYLEELETLACEAELDEDAARAIEEWKTHTELSSRFFIVAVDTVLTSADKDLAVLSELLKSSERSQDRDALLASVGERVTRLAPSIDEDQKFAASGSASAWSRTWVESDGLRVRARLVEGQVDFVVDDGTRGRTVAWIKYGDQLLARCTGRPHLFRLEPDSIGLGPTNDLHLLLESGRALTLTYAESTEAGE
jgi:hypothetical protein